MKIATGIFFKFGLPIIVIVGLCFTSYFILTKPINSLEKVNEKRISEIKEYEKAVYDANLSEVENEKLMFYIIMIGAFGILMVFGFHVIKLILNINADAFLFPEKYELVLKNEADSIRYVKDKLLETQFLKHGQLLTKEHVMKLLTYRNINE
jgi:hypothetical protein